MIVLKPIVHKTIWGGNKLNKYVKKAEGSIGHLYLVNGHKRCSNIVVGGKYANQNLNSIFEKEKDQWNMKEFEEFPLTIALVDAKENLSIQVHPDSVCAQKLEGKKIGKAESWLFLEEPNEGWIYNGCLCDSNTQIAEAVKNEKLESITKQLSIKKNDYVFVEAGTLHALTAGSMVYEIEYGSDFTYRFFDYNRIMENGEKRELHINKAMKSIKVENKQNKKVFQVDTWISEKQYEIKRISHKNKYKNEGIQLECISIIDGVGTLDNNKIYPGMSILLLPGEEINTILLEDAIIARLVK